MRLCIGTLAAVSWAAFALCAQSQTEPAEKALISSINGRVLFQTYCATCHGDSAKGDGPMAPLLKVQPADLTQITVRNGLFPAKNIERVIAGDVDLTAHGTREMPLWGPIFSQVASDQDLGRVRIANLVKYLESIQTPPRIRGIEKR
jgi:mono/diheme cytochrome c family protein